MKAEPNFNGVPLSSWSRRLGALFVDSLVVSAAAIPLLMLALVLIGLVYTEPNQSAGEQIQLNASELEVTLVIYAGAFLVILLAAGGYYGLTMARAGKRNGQSWGKQVFEIAVVRVNGQPVSFTYACLRQVLVIQFFWGYLVFTLTFTIGWLLNYLWPLWDRENRALHDMIVKSRVVRRDAAAHAQAKMPVDEFPILPESSQARR